MAKLNDIPPELLLLIISHLPSSSSFLSLSQTSTYLRSFLLHHAPTICNTHITTHHLRAATILLSTRSSSGWLTPTHSCVLAEERRVQRDKILFSGCGCASCRLFLLESRGSWGSASSLTLSEISIQPGSCFPCIPHLRPTPTQPVQCKTESEIARTIRLTEPGPQFLVFLERYGREIEIRHAMRPRPRGYSSVDEKGDGDVRTQEEKEKSRFDFMVGNYSVRMFLEDVERVMDLRDAACITVSNAEEDESDGKKNWKAKVKATMRWNGLRRKSGSKNSKLGAQHEDDILPERKRPLMFGEIEKADIDIPRRESWIKGLMWYYGPTSSSFSTTTTTTTQQPMRKRDKIQATLTKTKAKVGGMSIRVGGKIKRVFGRIQCGDGFRSLDD